MAKIAVAASLASSLIRFRGELLRSMRDAGHSVVALAPDPDEQTVAALTALDVDCLHTPLSRGSMNPLSDMRYLRALEAHLATERPDVLLAYTPKPVIYSGWACGKVGIHHVGLISGLGYGFGRETLSQRLLTPVLSTMFSLGLRKSRRVIFQNPDDRQLFIRRGIVTEEQAHLVAGSGVDPDRFTPQPLPNMPVFLLMARLIAEKGVREYVTAARQLKDRFPDARFLLAGWLEQRRGAISRAELAGWEREGVIEYLGILNDVRPAIAQASVYVLPSYYREGIPRSILEAMSMGRAIITSDAPGCRETVQEGRNGILIPVRDAKTLESAMAKLVMAPEEVKRMGGESRRMVEERFTVEQVNAQMLSAMGLSA